MRSIELVAFACIYTAHLVYSTSPPSMTAGDSEIACVQRCSRFVWEAQGEPLVRHQRQRPEELALTDAIILRAKFIYKDATSARTAIFAAHHGHLTPARAAYRHRCTRDLCSTQCFCFEAYSAAPCSQCDDGTA